MTRISTKRWAPPFLLLLLACSSARVTDRQATQLFREQKYEDAAKHLEAGYKEQGESGRDSLLYILDWGLALHSAGKLDESTKVFLKADKLAEIKDYTSIATETATFLTSNNLKDYKAEDFENVLINTYLAMNYAVAGNTEDAIVEAKRVNRKLLLMVTEGKRNYQQNAFARYLSAILYESEGNVNDAYIDYKETRKINPNLPALGRDLYRMAYLQHDQDDMDEWVETYKLTAEDKKAALVTAGKKGKAEIIVLYENGISPEKRPNPSFTQLPKFYSRSNPVSYANIELNGAVVGATVSFHDVEAAAIQNLDEKYGGMLAKKIVGIVAKEGVAYGVEKATGSPLLGALTRIGLYASDQADCRSWSLLPKDLQILRIPVEPGTYQLRALPVGAQPLVTKTVVVKAGAKSFVNWRFMP